MRGNRARRGPPGWAIWLALATSTTYGMYQVRFKICRRRNCILYVPVNIFTFYSCMLFLIYS